MSLINASKTDTERARLKKKQQKSFFGSVDNSKLNATKIDMEAELDRDYERLSKPSTQLESNEDNVLQKLKNHIVVCGIHSSIMHFILPLRAKYLESKQ